MTEDQQDQATAEAQQSDTLEVENLDQFVAMLVGWHTHKVQMLEHLLQIPEGTEMLVDDTTVTLTGDALAGFKAGIDIALMELGQLPFVVDLVDIEEPDEATAH